MEVFDYFGKLLSTEISISPAATRGLLKLSIKDFFGPFFPLSQLNYANLTSMIKKTLKKRLIDLEIKEVDKIIHFLLTELNKNQSLITIERV